MDTSYLAAKALWESGKRTEGFALLQAALRGGVGVDPFLPPEHLFTARRESWFETVVCILLTGQDPRSDLPLLQAPLARVVAALWTLWPAREWLDTLLESALRVGPRPPQADTASEPPHNAPGDLRALVQALAHSASQGLLTGQADSSPNGGRIVLTAEELAAVPAERWGPFAHELHTALEGQWLQPAALAWPRMLAADPQRVAARFLYDLFGHYGSSLTAGLARWPVVRELHRAYADAARSAIDQALEENEPRRTEALVRLAAGQRAVDSPEAWLADLARKLSD